MKAIKHFFIYYFYLIKYYIQIHLHTHLTDKVKKTKLFSLLIHHKVRQSYDFYPYYYHTYMVAETTLKFQHLLDTDEEIENAYIVALLHDTIEDCRKTYNDIKAIFGETIADMVYCCTELRGKNRKKRHGQQYYEDLKNNELASFVKLCDIYSNVSQSIKTGNSMFKAYQKEFYTIKKHLYRDKFKPLFDELQAMLKIEDQPKVACVLIEKDGKFLAVSRKDNHSDFGLPGGKQEVVDKTLKDTAIRETREETGLIINPVHLSLLYQEFDGKHETTTFLVNHFIGEINHTEPHVVEWVYSDELIDGSFGEYNKKVIDTYYSLKQ